MSDVNQAFRGLEQGMGNVGRNLSSMGRSLTTNVTLPIVAIGGAATKMAVDFETTMNQMVGLAGVSRESLEGIREEIAGISRETGKGPQELAEAFYFVASAGFEAGEAMDVLDMAARASASGMGNVQDIARVLGGVVNAYGKENLTAAEAADILTAAVAEGAAEASTFANVLPQVVPAAAQLGVGLDQVTGSIAAMTTAGTSAEMAAVGLNQIFTTLLKPTSQANETLKAFGLSAQGLRDQLESEGVISVLRTLETTFDDNEEAMTKVFGNVRAMRGAFTLLGLDAETLDGIMASTADSQGDLQEAFEATDDEGRSLAKAWAELQLSAIELGRDVMPTVVDIFRQLSDAVRAGATWWKSLSDDTKGAIIQFALLAAVAGPVLSIAGKLVLVLRGVVVGVRMLATVGKLMHTAWLHIPTVMGHVDVAMAAARRGMVAMSNASNMTIAKIGLVGAAAGALYTAYETNFLGIRDVLLGNRRDTNEWQRAVLGGLTLGVGSIGGLVHMIAGDLISDLDSIKRVLETNGQDIDAFMRRLGDYAERTGQTLEEAAAEVAQHFAAGGTVDAALQELPKTAERSLLVYEGEIASHMLAAKGIAATETQGAVDAITGTLDAGAGPVGAEADEISDEIAAAMEEARQSAADAARGMLDDLVGTLATGPDVIEDEMQALVDALSDPYKDVTRRADLETALAQDAIAANLESGDVRTEALAFEQVANWLRQYDLLEPGALERGELLNPAFQAGIDSNLDSALNWYRDNVAGEFASLSDIADELDRNGYSSLAAYARGVDRANRLELYDSISEFRRSTQSRTELDLAGQGRRAGNSWINGYMGTLTRAQQEFYAYASTVREILPGSEPKDPRSPWRGITKIGAAAAMEIINGWRSTLPVFRRVLNQFGGLPGGVGGGLGLSLAPMTAASGATFGSAVTSTDMAGGGGLTVNIHSHSLIPGSPKQLRDIGEAAGPALDDYFYRNGRFPRRPR